MTRWLLLAGKLLRSDSAATMVEYAILMAFVAAACVSAVTTFGSAISALFQKAVGGFPR